VHVTLSPEHTSTSECVHHPSDKLFVTCSKLSQVSPWPAKLPNIRTGWLACMPSVARSYPYIQISLSLATVGSLEFPWWRGNLFSRVDCQCESGMVGRNPEDNLTID
jgi:hypothetical protein